MNTMIVLLFLCLCCAQTYASQIIVDPRRTLDDQNYAGDQTKRPMRIHVDYQWKWCTDYSTFAEEFLLPPVLKLFQESIHVDRTTSPLIFQNSGDNRCGEIAIPDQYFDGIPNTDYVLFVMLAENCLGNKAADYANTCRHDQNDRPIMGYINICPPIDNKYLSTTTSTSTKQEQNNAILDQLILVTHEVTHAVGFSGATWPSMHKPDVITSSTFKNVTRNKTYICADGKENSTLNSVLSVDVVNCSHLLAQAKQNGWDPLDRDWLLTGGSSASVCSHGLTRGVQEIMIVIAVSVLVITLSLVSFSWFTSKYGSVCPKRCTPCCKKKKKKSKSKVVHIQSKSKTQNNKPSASKSSKPKKPKAPPLKGKAKLAHVRKKYGAGSPEYMKAAREIKR